MEMLEYRKRCAVPREDTPTPAPLVHPPSKYTTGYLHLTLAWVSEWNRETRARVLMEKTHSLEKTLFEEISWLKPTLEDKKSKEDIWLDFLISHLDWRGLCAWVRRLPFSEVHKVDECGFSSYDFAHLQKNLHLLHPYVVEVLHQALAQRGIFLENERGNFLPLMTRLARAGCLFGSALLDGGSAASSNRSGNREQQVKPGVLGAPTAPRGARGGRASVALPKASVLPATIGGPPQSSVIPPTNSSSLGGQIVPGDLPAEGGGISRGDEIGKLPMDDLLPFGPRLSPFHIYFVNYCIEEDMPNVLALYLQSYHLLEEFSSLQELVPELKIKDWSCLHLTGRLGNKHLFAASLQHAALLARAALKSGAPVEEEGVSSAHSAATGGEKKEGAAAQDHVDAKSAGGGVGEKKVVSGAGVAGGAKKKAPGGKSATGVSGAAGGVLGISSSSSTATRTEQQTADKTAPAAGMRGSTTPTKSSSPTIHHML